MTNRTAHKPSEASRAYTIHGTRQSADFNPTIRYTGREQEHPRFKTRSKAEEARKAALEYDLKVRLERIVAEVQEASR